MNRCKNKRCNKPVLLMEFPAGERLWMHVNVLAVHDTAGVLYDVKNAYYYCSSGRRAAIV